MTAGLPVDLAVTRLEDSEEPVLVVTRLEAGPHLPIEVEVIGFLYPDQPTHRLAGLVECWPEEEQTQMAHVAAWRQPRPQPLEDGLVPAW